MAHLAIVGDVHLRDEAAAQIIEELHDLVDRLDRTDPDHLLVLGDLIEDDDAGTDLAQLTRLKEILAEAPCPVTYLLGNHDIQNLTRAKLADILEQEQFHGVVELEETPIVFLDSPSGAGGTGGMFGAEQREWLEGVLQTHDNPLICSHHPLGTFDLATNVWFGDYPERAFPADRREMLDVLEAAGPIRGSISGHIHQTGYVDFRGIYHGSLNAFSKETPDKPVTGTYAEVQISDRVDVRVKQRGEEVGSFTFD